MGVSLSLLSNIGLATPWTAAEASGYGTGLPYFAALERERAISEEFVPLSARDERRANGPRQAPVGQKRNAPPLTRGVPLSLGAGDDGSEDGEYGDLTTLASDTGEVEGARVNGKRWASAAFQWTVIFGVAYNVRKSRTRGAAVTKRLGLAGKAGEALVGSTWRLTLDIGREPGTWMPPSWGASGRRLLLPIAVRLKENGVVETLAVGAFLPMTISDGTWRLEGDALKFDVKMSGMTRGDIELPEDSLHFRTAAWGATMASKGRLLLLQTRFGFRREWRMVGVFKAEPLGDDDVDGAEGKFLEGEDLYEANKKKLSVPPMRITERQTGA